MNNKRITLFALLIFSAAVFISCSSAPKETDIVNDRKNKAAELTDFGNSYYANGEYTQALVFFKLALDENVASDNEPGIIKSCNSAGKAAMNADDMESAEKYFLRALNISEKLNDKNFRSVSSNNLGSFI